MALPIPLQLSPREPQRELNSRLQQAPLKHAEALIAAHELLQGLHDSGLLELLRGTLGGGEKIVEQVVDVARGPDVILATRNLLRSARVLGATAPALLTE